MKISLPVAMSLLVFGQLAACAQSAGPSAEIPIKNQIQPLSKSTVAANYGKLPLSFEANHGQSDPQVRFLSRGQGYSLFLTDQAAVLALTRTNAVRATAKGASPKTDVVRMELAGASQGVKVDGAEPLPGKTNYFIGKDPANWRSNVPTYGKVKYSGVYPGVDLVYYGNQRQLEYDFIVAPGADATPVRLHFAGASKLKLNRDGDLTVAARNGEIAFHKPVVYQMRDGQRELVDGKFSLVARNTVAFRLGNYDHSRELVIDPVLIYSTYLGGTSGVPSDSYVNSAAALAVDASGNAYVTGLTYSTSFPITDNAFQKTSKQQVDSFPAIYIAKLNQTGTALEYSTFLGGSVARNGYGGDTVADITVDSSGNAYVAGETYSTDFPITSGAFETSNNCVTVSYTCALFITKISPTGSALVYSTYLIADIQTYINAIALDSAGEIYLAGNTRDVDFPTTSGALQRKGNGNGNGFVTKFNAAGSGLIYSTFLNDGPQSSGYVEGISALAVDTAGSAYVAGRGDFPTTAGAIQPTPKNTTGSEFVVKLNPAGSAVNYATYLSGSTFGDYISGIAVDASGHAYVTGLALSTDFPTTSGAFQTFNKAAVLGQANAFVSKLNTSGTALAYSTYLGGTGVDGATYYPAGDKGTAIAVDGAGNAIVTGGASSVDFPVTSDAIQKFNNGAGNETFNAFLTKVNPSGTALVYSTYFGGSAAPAVGDGTYYADLGTSIALDSLGNAYIAGNTNSVDFPVTDGAYQQKGLTLGDAFLTKFAFHGATRTTLDSDSPTQNVGVTLTFTAHVTPVSAGDTPTGRVSLLIDGVDVKDAPLAYDGHALFYYDALPPGKHSVVASYSGDPARYSASADVLTQPVTGQVAAPVFFPLGGTYRVAQQVAITTPTLGATVYYTTDGSTPSKSSTMYASPVAVAASKTLRAIAVQTGNTASSAATAVFTIKPAALPTTTLLISSANPSTLGSPVTLTATVTSQSAPTPTGSVAFRNGKVIMAVVPLSDGVASFTTSDLTLLGHDVTAVYTGSATNAEKGSPVLRQIVNP